MEDVDGLTEKRTKPEPPLYLDVGFDEALTCFSRTDPKQVQEGENRAKQKKKPGDNAARRSSAKDD